MRFILSVIMLGLITLPALAGQVISGKVVGVTDGDTITVLTPEKKQLKVRLAEIDTPEKRQPYGKRSKQALSSLIFGKQVEVESRGKDRYQRTIGKIFLDGTDINAEMVRRGHAWVYRKYARDPGLFDLEDEARTQELGLWRLPEVKREPPWEWRRKHK